MLGKTEAASAKIGKRVLMGQHKWDFMLSVMIGIHVRSLAAKSRMPCDHCPDAMVTPLCIITRPRALLSPARGNTDLDRGHCCTAADIV